MRRVAGIAPPVLPTHVSNHRARMLKLDFERRDESVVRVHDDVPGPSLKIETDGKLQRPTS